MRQVEVMGNKYLSSDKVMAIARIPVGENIFLVDLDETENRFSSIIQIKSIRFKRKLPDRIIINVSERTPFAMAVIGDVPALIDEDGCIIARKNLQASIYLSDIASLPAIRGISKRSIEEGKRLNSSDRVFIKNSINLLSKFLNLRTVQIDIGNREDIIVYVEDIMRARIGDYSNIEKKVNVLKALLNSMAGKWQKIAYIDVRVPDNPVIKFD